MHHLSEQELIRRDNLSKLAEAGIDAYPSATFEINSTTEEIKSNFKSGDTNYQEVCLAGRLMSKRIMGKASFAELQDAQGATLQTAVVSVVSGANVVVLDFNITPGTGYQLTRVGTEDLYRNNPGFVRVMTKPCTTKHSKNGLTSEILSESRDTPSLLRWANVLSM